MIREAARQAGLQAEDESGEAFPELHIVLIGPRKMRTMNAQFLGHDYVTDVLAFDFRDGTDAGKVMNRLVGEVYVCPQVAQQAAREYTTDVIYELVLYIVHGLLHLAGERDKTAPRQRRMKQREERIMNILQDRYDLDSIFDTSECQ